MKRKQRLFSLLFAAAAALFLALALFLTYRPTAPSPVILRIASPPRPAEAYRLDLNTATAGELESLPSIGPVLAGNILRYREEHGPFQSPEDLLAVEGIGEKTLETLTPYITFE